MRTSRVSCSADHKSSLMLEVLQPVAHSRLQKRTLCELERGGAHEGKAIRYAAAGPVKESLRQERCWKRGLELAGRQERQQKCSLYRRLTCGGAPEGGVSLYSQ